MKLTLLFMDDSSCSEVFIKNISQFNPPELVLEECLVTSWCLTT